MPSTVDKIVDKIDSVIIRPVCLDRHQQRRWRSLSRPSPSSPSSTMQPSTDWRPSPTWCGGMVLFKSVGGQECTISCQERRRRTISTAICGFAQDEPFHVKQTRQYCAGNWADWDPKITTFPGLYVVAVAYARLLQLAASSWRAPHVSNSHNWLILRAHMFQHAAACT
jgi:hypothetical protein